MAPKLSQEPRKIGELTVIIGFAVLVLALSAAATLGILGGKEGETSSVGGAPQPSPTAVEPSPTAGAPERPTEDPAATRDPQDTWVPPEQFPGGEAIQPSLDPVAPGEPRITVKDVEAYITHAYPDTDEIVSIEFLPAELVEARIDVAPGFYGGRLLCAVELRGSFNVGVPPEVQEKLRKEGRTPEVPELIVIFDALTGNLLSETAPPP